MGERIPTLEGFQTQNGYTETSHGVVNLVPTLFTDQDQDQDQGNNYVSGMLEGKLLQRRGFL